MLDYVRPEDLLEAVFAAHRGRSHEDVRTFATLVRLVADALLEYEGSGRQAFQRTRHNGEPDTVWRAVYGKLARVPLSLSLALLAQAVVRLNERYPHVVADKAAPRSLRKLAVVYHDGKTIKHVAKRLKVLRKYRGKLLGGKPDHRRRRYVRRMRAKRGGGQEERILLTDLGDAEAYPAADLLQVYLERWGIERIFQQVTEVFQLRSLIGSSPRATIF